MSLIKKNEWFSNLLSDPFDEDKLQNPFKKSFPAVNISENETEYLIEVCTPGIKKEDLKLDVSEGILTISYKTEASNEEKNKTYFKKEFSYSSFERKMTLPKNILEDQIKARFEDGILNITISKDQSKKVDTTSIPID
ncbi:Hsp20/alpha crystallin family protein [uncultured Cetobacterium sp.]|uniref:Hsp20/alpha crystallin family protein n=1 Tax=uncultured Cetobacterium sp. TaxID=527638 RepID=UPI0026155390|nr:Hsp20/alpha crystallin family protein [uncultured Cetobacterium sp.]